MISDNLSARIKVHEGFSSKVYRCASGAQTIAYGRVVDPDEEGTGITEEEARRGSIIVEPAAGTREDGTRRHTHGRARPRH